VTAGQADGAAGPVRLRGDLPQPRRAPRQPTRRRRCTCATGPTPDEAAPWTTRCCATWPRSSGWSSSGARRARRPATRSASRCPRSWCACPRDAELAGLKPPGGRAARRAERQAGPLPRARPIRSWPTTCARTCRRSASGSVSLVPGRARRAWRRRTGSAIARRGRRRAVPFELEVEGETVTVRTGRVAARCPQPRGLRRRRGSRAARGPAHRAHPRAAPRGADARRRAAGAGRPQTGGPRGRRSHRAQAWSADDTDARAALEEHAATLAQEVLASSLTLREPLGGHASYRLDTELGAAGPLRIELRRAAG
jgi:hypothetical protein